MFGLPPSVRGSQLELMTQIVIGTVTTSLPAGVVGYLTIRRWKFSLEAGLTLASLNALFFFLVYIGIISNKLFNPLEPLGGLLLIIASIGALLYAVAIYCKRSIASER